MAGRAVEKRREYEYFFPTNEKIIWKMDGQMDGQNRWIDTIETRKKTLKNYKCFELN